MKNTLRRPVLWLLPMIVALGMPHEDALAIVVFHSPANIAVVATKPSPTAKPLKSPKPVTDPLAIIAAICLLIFPLLSIILGALSLKRIKSKPERFKGRVLAKVAFILGIVFTAIGILLTFIALLYFLAFMLFLY